MNSDNRNEYEYMQIEIYDCMLLLWILTIDFSSYFTFYFFNCLLSEKTT